MDAPPPAPPLATSRLGYARLLDGLRGIAVLAVAAASYYGVERAFLRLRRNARG